jgi:hypothetical protein
MDTKINDARFLVDVMIPVRERSAKRFVRATGFLQDAFDFVQFIVG